jgi:hypothetical protein
MTTHATRTELSAELRQARASVAESAARLRQTCRLSPGWHATRSRHLLLVLHAGDLHREFRR